jgi:hypothetical protein
MSLAAKDLMGSDSSGAQLRCAAWVLGCLTLVTLLIVVCGLNLRRKRRVLNWCVILAALLGLVGAGVYAAGVLERGGSGRPQ